MSNFTKTTSILFLLSSLLIKCNSNTINAHTIYEHNPFKKQMMYTPERDKQYNEKIEKQNKENPKKHANNPKKCIFCMLAKYDNDKKNLLITRFRYHNLFMNLYPYQKGHLLLVPKSHVKTLSELSYEERIELIEILSATPNIIKHTLDAAGVNIGINIGKIAGASKPDHIHIHIIPRYEIENVSFIHLVCETQVIGYDMPKLYDLLKKSFDELRDSWYSSE